MPALLRQAGLLCGTRCDPNQTVANAAVCCGRYSDPIRRIPILTPRPCQAQLASPAAKNLRRQRRFKPLRIFAGQSGRDRGALQVA